MSERAPTTSITSSDDPHLTAYLTLRYAVVTGQLRTQADIDTYAAELRQGLPEGGPPPPIAALIAADIRITCPVVADLLWTP